MPQPTGSLTLLTVLPQCLLSGRILERGSLPGGLSPTAPVALPSLTAASVDSILLAEGWNCPLLGDVDMGVTTQ